MIPKNELRIGNMLYYYKPLEQKKQIMIVTEIFEEQNEYFVSSKEYAAINIKSGVIPIPITPEILEACGFEKAEHYSIDIFRNKERSFRIRLLKNGTTHIWRRFPGENFNRVAVHVKHLHQLQNLYFVLTGEELTVNIHDRVTG